MYHSLEKIIDLIFPPRSETLLVRGCTTDHCRVLLRVKKIDDVTALTSFQDPIIRALIHEAKCHGNTHAQKMLGVILSEFITIHPQYGDALWLPIPLSGKRLRERGYNQVSEILEYTKTEVGSVSILQKVLVRSRDTIPQTSLSKDKRLENMAGAFEINNLKIIKDTHIVILDDVMTTGATLHAAKAALLPHSPASITLLALAH